MSDQPPRSGATYEELARLPPNVVVRAEPFEALDLELGALWAR